MNSKLLCRLIIALSGVAAMVAGCKDVEIKPQDPGNYNRALRQRAEIVKIDYDDEDSAVPENTSIQLPATSQPANWIRFKTKRLAENQTALDTDSISVGGDGITRYTLLVRTPRGVDNVSYEGIRCATREWKMYATGRSDGGWSRVPEPRWRRIDEVGINAVRLTLFDDYACDRGGSVPKDGKAVVSKIKKSNDGLLARRRDGSN